MEGVGESEECPTAEGDLSGLTSWSILFGRFWRQPGPGIVTRMSDGSRKFAKPAAAFGVLATMASIWWFALRPRRKNKIDETGDGQ
jgi:hypothetical protein